MVLGPQPVPSIIVSKMNDSLADRYKGPAYNTVVFMVCRKAKQYSSVNMEMSSLFVKGRRLCLLKSCLLNALHLVR